MMTHAFPLNASLYDHTYSYWVGEAFSYDEINRICDLGDSLPQVRGITGGASEGAKLTDMRDCAVGWISPSEETKWLYDRITNMVMRLNRDFYGFDLQGLQDLQYTVYNADAAVKGAHYGWHPDMMGKNDGAQRKLSLVLQLSDPFDYEGGELQLHERTKVSVPKGRGIVYAFPSWVLHRVTPVTAGIRKTLVAWAVGPQFR